MTSPNHSGAIDGRGPSLALRMFRGRGVLQGNFLNAVKDLSVVVHLWNA
jgi:hypothetical protein